MIAMVCVDDAMGMLFNKRRQSQDRLLRERVLALTQDGTLWMNEYSLRQFAGHAAPQIQVAEDFLQRAAAGEYCFVENTGLLPFQDRIEAVYLYRWNRSYPADRYFDLPLDAGGWTLRETADFAGSSHETITEEIYRR